MLAVFGKRLASKSHQLHRVILCPSLRVIDVKMIHSVIALVPHRPFGPNLDQRYFVIEKPGLELAELGGHREDVPDDE